MRVYQEYLSVACWLKAKPEESVAEYFRAKALAGERPAIVDQLRRAYEASGVRGLYQKEIELLMRKWPGEICSPRMRIAMLYGPLGQNDQAFAWLEKAYRDHSPDIVILKSYPLFDPLRSDLRFADLMRRVGLQK